MRKLETIWLVDDDEIYRYITKTYIEFEDAADHIVSFNSGEEAINKLEHKNGDNYPDVILLDINMPRMNGWDFLDKFKEIKPEIAHKINIFMVSSSDNEIDLKRAGSYEEVIDYVPKPVDDTKIKQILGKL